MTLIQSAKHNGHDPYRWRPNTDPRKLRRMPSPKPHRPVRAKKASNKSGHFENIEWLIAEGGAIHVGRVASIECIASAADEHMCYAMLARCDGETLLALLVRLDRAIALAAETSEPIDEINGP